MPSWDTRGALSQHLEECPHTHLDPALCIEQMARSIHPSHLLLPPPTPHHVEGLTRPTAYMTCCLFDPTSSAPLLSMLQCAPARPLPHCCLLLPNRLLLPLPLRPRQPWLQLLLPMLPLPPLQVLPQALWRVRGNWSTDDRHNIAKRWQERTHPKSLCGQLGPNSQISDVFQGS